MSGRFKATVTVKYAFENHWLKSNNKIHASIIRQYNLNNIRQFLIEII